MSKRAQERRTEEGLVVSKSRLACLASRNLSAKQASSLDSGATHGSGNQELGLNSVFHKHRETCAGEGPELSDDFSRVAKR